MSFHRIIFAALTVFLVVACNNTPNFGGGFAPLTPQEATYTQVQNTILGPMCLSCHSDANSLGEVSVTSYASLMTSAGSVVPYQPYQSQIFKRTLSGNMPKDGTPLSGSQLLLIYDWIAYGAPNN